MNIDYNWGEPPKANRVTAWFKRVFGHKPVPLHCSNHYRRDSFFPEEKPPTLF